jgi:PAS domain S-box-containing protein
MRFSFHGAILYANSASLPLRKLWNSELGQKVPAYIANSVKDVCGLGVSKEVEVECGDTIFSLIMACSKSSQDINVYGRDITERKLMEESLRSLTLRYKAILAAVPDIIMEVDNNKVYTWANKAGYEFFGDDIIGKEAALYFEGEQQIYNMVQPLFNGSDEVIYVESWQRRIDGEKRLLAWRCRVLKDSEGNVTGVLSTAKDITERKQAEEQIRKEKAFSEAMLDSLPGIFYLFDHTGRILRWNRTFETVSGYSAEEIAAMSALDFFTGDDRTLIKESIGKVFETGATNVEGTFISKDGRRTPHYLVGVLFVMDGVPCCISMGIEITELKHLEAQLRHAQKMEAVGTLAGGIAHDFNNILNVIMGYGSMVFDSLEAGSRSREQMNEVLIAADRATDLTKRLLVFSRKQVVEVKPININELILGLQKMLVRIIQESIDFNLELTGSPLIVLADAGQIEQVLINLASNAKDAMQEGGRLTIGTELEEMDDEYVAAYGYGMPGKYALITVADTGQGMDAETQKKIFEPFFTTKGIGEGTGLGLAISYGIIKQHGGYINVYSEPGQGTIFKIYMPLSEVAASPDKKTEADIPVEGGNETILLTEDDASIRTLLRVVLESFGYCVVTAVDGENALEKFMEKRDEIQLVILDMIMPKKNGKEVSEAIRKVSLQTKILFMSGYTMDIVKTNELIETGVDFIHKPFPPRELLIKVREVLDR